MIFFSRRLATLLQEAEPGREGAREPGRRGRAAPVFPLPANPEARPMSDKNPSRYTGALVLAGPVLALTATILSLAAGSGLRLPCGPVWFRAALWCLLTVLSCVLWRALRVTPGFERRQMDALRKELDQNYNEENDIRQPSVDMRQKKLSSIYRT